MGLGNRLRAAWGALAGRGAIGKAALGYGAGYPGGPTYSDAFRSRRGPTPPQLLEAYKSIVYSCTLINAVGVARVPLRLFCASGSPADRPRKACGPKPVAPGVAKGLRERPYLARSLAKADRIDEVTDHPLLDALESPNEFFDYNLLILMTVASLDVLGVAYWEPSSAEVLGAKVPRELWPLPAHLVVPIPGSGKDGNVLAGYRYLAEDKRPDELVRFRHVDLRDPYLGAYAPARAGFQYADMEDEWVSMQRNLFGNGVRPGVLISPKDPKAPMDRENARRLELALNQRASAGNAFRSFVEHTGNLDVANLTYPPTDLAGMDVSDYDLQRLANCFGVPISLLKTEDVNRANAEAGQYQHAVYAIHPRCNLVAGVMTHRLARPLDRRLFFAFDDCVPADEERRAKVFDIKLGNGSLTVNEARAEDGFEPAEWGEEPWLSNTLVQPSVAAEQREQAAQAQQPAADQAEPEPDPEEEREGEEETDAAEKALVASLASVLARLEKHLDAGAAAAAASARVADPEPEPEPDPEAA